MRMKINQMQSLLVGGLLSCGLMMVGCSTDNSIDLNDLDTTVGFNADSLKIPGGETNEFNLGDVLELTEDDVISTLPADSGRYKKGDYQFKKSDDVTAAKPEVKQVSFSASEANQTEKFKVTIPDWMAKITDYTSGVDQEFAFPFTFDTASWTAELTQYASDMAQYLTDKAIYEATHTGTAPVMPTPPNPMKYYQADDPIRVTTFTYGGEGNDNILSLSQATIDGSVTLHVGLDQLKGKVKLTEIDLYLPDFLSLKVGALPTGASYDAEFIGDTILRLKNVSTSEAVHLPLIFNELKNFDEKVNPVSKASKDSSFLVLNNKELAMQGAVKMRMRINSKDFELLPTGTHDVEADVIMSDNIIVTHAEGKFNPDINIDPSVVEIGNDLPDFLTDPECDLRFANPTIKLLISNNLNVKLKVDARMVAYRDEAMTDSMSMKIPTMTIYPDDTADGKSVRTLAIINRQQLTNEEYLQLAKDNEANIEARIMKTTSETRNTGDIAQLLNPIPKKLKFYFDAYADPDYVAKIDLCDPNNPNSTYGRSYEVNPSYEFVAPLALQPGAQIVYNDTIDDWNKDIADNDIQIRDGDQITLTADFHNGTPLDLQLTPILVDKNKKEITGVTVSKVTIPSNFGKPVTATSPIKIEMKFNDGDDFQKLDGMIFRVVAKATNETPLNKETQTVKISNMMLNIHGHISLDLDKD